ncbi:MAG: hypothetical protein CMJ40_00745 [Phycisphaerae bacterium]|nr:hypothetical protein [Phycisphaerae bacterium]|tara:strand:+ start:1898 stop:2512 length:615 start_codon:yes stop_codon:yes gene_type:complete
MSKQANITSVESLDAFRADVREFQQVAMRELMSMRQDVQKMETWITLDQPPKWKIRSRKIDAEINNARSDLERAKISRPDQDPRIFVEHRKALQRARAKQQVAMDRIRDLKRWGGLIKTESMIMNSGLQSLGHVVDGEMTRLIVMLKVLADHLDSYLKSPPPPGGFNEWAAEMQEQDRDLSREGEDTTGVPTEESIDDIKDDAT